MNSSNSSNKKITKTAASTKAAPAKIRSSEEAKVAPPKSRSRTPVDQQRPGTKAGKRAPSSKAIESEILPSKSPAAGGKTTKTNTATTPSAARGRQAVTQMSELD